MWFYFIASVFIHYCFQYGNCVSNVVMINLPDGAVLKGTSLNGHQTFYEFKGIPYAKPPTGKLRFEAPQPYGPIEGVFESSQEIGLCPQIDDEINVVGKEDCLKLDVYIHKRPVRNANATAKSPVIVFVHSGGFQRGSSSEMPDPGAFLKHGIIVVSVNYRLGVLGFYSTTLETSPGNYGLLDQLEALRWVQKNIGAFGGDSSQVTLATHGLFHLLSPLSHGLFAKVIVLVGSSHDDTRIQTNAYHWAIKLGTRLDCLISDPKFVLNCLKKRNIEDLLSASQEIRISTRLFPFLPVVENILKGNGDFLPDHPIQLLKNSKVNKIPVLLEVPNNINCFEEDSKDHLEESTGNQCCAIDTPFKNDTKQPIMDRVAYYLSKAGCPTYIYSIDASTTDNPVGSSLDTWSHFAKHNISATLKKYIEFQM